MKIYVFLSNLFKNVVILNKFHDNKGIFNHLFKNGNKTTTCNQKLVLIL